MDYEDNKELMNCEFVKTAAIIYYDYPDVKENIHEYTQALPDKLISELIEINELCEKAGGKLRSRQIIAKIIYNYKNTNGIYNTHLKEIKAEGEKANAAYYIGRPYAINLGCFKCNISKGLEILTDDNGNIYYKCNVCNTEYLLNEKK